MHLKFYMIQRSVSFLSSQNLEVIRWVTSLLSPSKNMQFCNEQIRTQPLFSPPCASATYGSARMCRRKNPKRRNKNGDVLHFKMRVAIMPTLSSLVAPQVVPPVTTTFRIMTSFCFTGYTRKDGLVQRLIENFHPMFLECPENLHHWGHSVIQVFVLTHWALHPKRSTQLHSLRVIFELSLYRF